MKVVIYNKNLNPAFWNENKNLLPMIRNALLKIAREFIKDIELKIHIRDIYFLGSSANYNWTPTSDLDIHILVDMNDLNASDELAKKITKTLAKKWNEEQEISVKGYNVEVYIQDISEENRATGVYSLISNKWVKEASPQNIVLDKNLIQQKFTTWVQKINNAIINQNPDRLKKILEDLVKMRDVGLSASGEFSTENIVFKVLRQRGDIKKLKDKIQQTKNSKLSVKDGFEPTSFGPNPASTEGLSELGYYQKQIDKMKQM